MSKFEKKENEIYHVQKNKSATVMSFYIENHHVHIKEGVLHTYAPSSTKKLIKYIMYRNKSPQHPRTTMEGKKTPKKESSTLTLRFSGKNN